MGNRQRRFRHIGGKHDASQAASARPEYPFLLGMRKASERGRSPASVVAVPVPGPLKACLRRPLPSRESTLARKKDEHIAQSASNGFIDRIQDGLFDIAFFIRPLRPPCYGVLGRHGWRR